MAARLAPGDVFTLPGGQGTIQLDGWSRWVKLQIGSAPGAPLVFGAIAAAIAGLYLSLFVRPRRVWLRLSPGSDETAVLEVAGLDRANNRSGLNDDVQTLLTTLTGVDDPKKEDP